MPVGRILELKLDEVYRELQEGYDLLRLAAAAAALRATWVAAVRLGAFTGAMRSAVERVAAVVERLRIDYARAYRLDELAASAGFADPFYFTRCFRRAMGCAPLAYRRIQKG